MFLPLTMRRLRQELENIFLHEVKTKFYIQKSSKSKIRHFKISVFFNLILGGKRLLLVTLSDRPFIATVNSLSIHCPS